MKALDDCNWNGPEQVPGPNGRDGARGDGPATTDRALCDGVIALIHHEGGLRDRWRAGGRRRRGPRRAAGHQNVPNDGGQREPRDRIHRQRRERRSRGGKLAVLRREIESGSKRGKKTCEFFFRVSRRPLPTKKKTHPAEIPSPGAALSLRRPALIAGSGAHPTWSLVIA